MDDGNAGCFLSLILPAYNEEAGIANAVAEADAALAGLGVSYEILVVDDGSRDRTADVVTSLQCPHVRLVRHDANRGYGAALRSGFEAARGQRIAFTDADCQFHLDDLALLLPLTDQHPIAVGYRVGRQDPWLRKFYSRGYNLLARVLLGTPVRDIDCALKVFRREALERILPETSGFFVNTEMLTRARQLHMDIAEVGVRHRPRQRGESKVSTGDIPRVLNALLPFWWTKVLFAAPSPGMSAAIPGGGRARRPPGIGVPHPGAWGQTVLLGILFALACILFLGRLDHPLLEPEEARYAEIPRQMLLDGRFVTPVLHGEDYWQKPPLLYWLVMASYSLLGVHDWAARLIPALAGIGCVLVTTWWARRTLGFWPGLVSGAILTLSARFLYLAGMLTMDGLLCFCVLASLACGHLALTEPTGRRRWLILAALACAFGVLTKGPVALVLVGVPLSAFAFLDRRSPRPTLANAAIFLGIVAGMAGPWFAVMAWNAPAAAGSFLWLHNLMRYFAPIDHEKPSWFYLPSLALGMLPWSLLLVPMAPYLVRKSLRTGRRRPAALGVFVLAFAWCVLFFSLSGCKRPAYVLPAFPLLALILGTFVTHGLPWQRWMHSMQGRQQWAHRLGYVGIAMGITLVWAVAIVGLVTLTEAIVTSAVFGAAAFGMSRRGPTWSSWANCAAIVLAVLLCGQFSWLPAYHERFGLRRQIEIASEYEQEEPMPIVSYPKRWDSIGFYKHRRDVIVHGAGDIDALLRDLKGHRETLIFVRRESLGTLRTALPADLELQVLGDESDFVVVGVVRPR